LTAHAEDMVLVPRAELDALRAENRRLRREAGDREALKRIRSDSGEGRTFTREELAEAWGISKAGIFCCQCLCVGFGVLHDDDNLPVRALRDRVPDGQTVRRKVKTIGTWQRIYLGKRVGKRRDWLFEQVEDRPMGGVPEWLRQSLKLVPDSVREAKDPVTYSLWSRTRASGGPVSAESGKARACRSPSFATASSGKPTSSVPGSRAADTSPTGPEAGRRAANPGVCPDT
jgi:hypothetical protein